MRHAQEFQPPPRHCEVVVETEGRCKAEASEGLATATKKIDDVAQGLEAMRNSNGNSKEFKGIHRNSKEFKRVKRTLKHFPRAHSIHFQYIFNRLSPFSFRLPTLSRQAQRAASLDGLTELSCRNIFRSPSYK